MPVGVELEVAGLERGGGRSRGKRDSDGDAQQGGAQAAGFTSAGRGVGEDFGVVEREVGERVHGPPAGGGGVVSCHRRDG
ncbi:hypothetical protein GCM10009574_080010 [Streptomyces asiaticus]|uniref:Uncharacterized protein n=2 Tax=Streptomyces rhizosphaericus TaxID=114699 RepID=A0ABP4CYD3_9ACTN